LQACRRCRSADELQIRRLEAADLDTLNRLLPVWNRGEYARRLVAQARGELEQAVAWEGDLPVGRGMVLFPEHEEYSESARREGCADVRDVFVDPAHRRRGAARAVMGALEEAARARGFRPGLSVSIDESASPARALYDALGYRRAHGPYLTSTVLEGDDPLPVGAILVYVVKDL
jgi:GNAT superfamily N-acetyltransferase